MAMTKSEWEKCLANLIYIVLSEEFRSW
jgi:hypothetical protein